MTNPTSNEREELAGQQIFLDLAKEAEQLLIDHGIELPTNTLPGHLAIWCQRYMEVGRAQLLQKIESEVIGRDDYPNLMTGSSGQACNEIRNQLRAEQRVLLATYKEKKL